MKVINKIRRSRKRDYVGALAQFFVKKSGVDGSAFHLIIFTETDFAKKNDGAAAGTRMNEDDDIEVVFDSKLDGKQIMLALSHEMIHVRQLAHGELAYIDDKPFWQGEDASGFTYETAPWEEQAYSEMVDLIRTINMDQPASSLRA